MAAGACVRLGGGEVGHTSCCGVGGSVQTASCQRIIQKQAALPRQLRLSAASRLPPLPFAPTSVSVTSQRSGEPAGLVTVHAFSNQLKEGELREKQKCNTILSCQGRACAAMVGELACSAFRGGATASGVVPPTLPAAHARTPPRLRSHRPSLVWPGTMLISPSTSCSLVASSGTCWQ